MVQVMAKHAQGPYTQNTKHKTKEQTNKKIKQGWNPDLDGSLNTKTLPCSQSLLTASLPNKDNVTLCSLSLMVLCLCNGFVFSICT
jgi:hypothetical protein